MSKQERTKVQNYLDNNLWPLIIIAILTGTIAVNIGVLTIAAQNPPELMTENYYEKGVDLKQVVTEKQETQRTGWKVTASMVDPQLVMLTAIDAAGLPRDSLTGRCSLYRPSSKQLDQESVQILSMGGGRYAVKTATPLLRGAWECVADLSLGQKHFRDRLPFFVE
ncbi:MAG: FixH family protein [bacterium]|nr:FixH family protein [bacterium]